MAGLKSAAGVACALAACGFAAACGGSSSPVGAGTTTTTSSGSAVKGAGLLPYAASLAHFTADFPAAPKKSSVPASFANFHMQIYLAASTGPTGIVVAEEEDITPALPANQVTAALVSALSTLASTSGLSVTSQPAQAAYRTFESEAATYSKANHTYRAISFMADHNARLYILFGSTNIFAALQQSLKLTN